jgi:DNA-binding transcriptional LysR family regulator
MMETFAKVVETSSFTAAADRLQLSKSFVSKQVSQLESELGTRLLYRTTRKLSLTEEGMRFYKHCQLIISEADHARAEIIESQSSPSGKIRITIPQSLIIAGAGQAFLKFQQKYPDIELDVIVSGKFYDLVDNGIDLAIRVGQLEDSMLVSRKLDSCFFQVVAAPQYLKKHGVPKHPKNLKEHSCLIYGNSKEVNNWPFRMSNGETIMLKAQGKLTSNDGLLIVSAALEGMGIAFGPSFLFKKHLDLGTLSLLLPEYQLPTAISAIYPANRNLPRRVRMLIDFLTDILGSEYNLNIST